MKKYEVHPLPGVVVETMFVSVRRTYVMESETFVEELLRIVKQVVLCMIHVEKILVSHKQFVVASDFVQSIEQLTDPGLLLYVSDFVPQASSRPLSDTDVYESDYSDPPAQVSV